MKREKAEAFVNEIVALRSHLTDEQALQAPNLFAEYKVGISYQVDDLFTYGTNSVGDPQLYRVVQAHTSQAD